MTFSVLLIFGEKQLTCLCDIARVLLGYSFWVAAMVLLGRFTILNGSNCLLA